MSKLSSITTETIQTFAISFVIFLVIYYLLAFPEIVSGASMQPTLYTGERLMVERITGRLNRFKKGDIVIFNPPGNSSLEYVKRVIGLPGERFELINCSIFFLNDQNEKIKLAEPYLKQDECTKSGTVIKENVIETIPQDYFFVLGDNRQQSADSRFFGFVKKDRLEGKVLFRFWPIDRFKTFK